VISEGNPAVSTIAPPASWLTPDEACAHLQVTRRTLERYRSAGLLRAYRLGSTSVRFRLTDLDALLQPISHERGA
jgi:excisionase family DNA binding protein